MSLRSLQILQQSNKISTGAVIFLHGSGDTGKGLLDWVKFLLGDHFALPYMQIYFPTAPLRPYTPLQGGMSSVWFDRYDITPEVPEHIETLDSISIELSKLVDKITSNGIPMNRIVLGGFSMGGALALHQGFKYTPGFAGVFTLSSFINNNSSLYSNIKDTKTPLCMFHGDRDTLVPMQWGEQTYKQLTEIGVDAKFNIVKNAMHELKKKELDDLFSWIQKVVPPL